MCSASNDDDDDDDLWSVAMLPPSVTTRPAVAINGTVADGWETNHEDNEICAAQSFTVLPPHPSEEPLVLNLQLNCNDGVLSDVSGIPWDAALLLSGFLYGTSEGRRLCYDACFRSGNEGGGGILELGSGLGIVGLAAAAAASSVRGIMHKEESNVKRRTDDAQNADQRTTLSAEESDDKAFHRVVLTDRNDVEILSHLRKNVDANRRSVAKASSQRDHLQLSVEPCDWMDVSRAVRSDLSDLSSVQCPTEPFNLILGSALVYLPEHAATCADTLFHYLTRDGASNATEDAPQRQAIIVQFLDRDGFATHFLPRCREMSLEVSCRELDGELIERVQRGWKRRIPSAEDYRIFVIKDGQ